MNPFEEQLLGLPLPQVRDSLRDQVLWDSGRRQGERSARKWQGLSLALALAMGTTLIPWRPAAQPQIPAPNAPEPLPTQLTSQSDPVEEPPTSEEPWLASYLKQHQLDRELQVLHATRLTPLEPVIPPPWAVGPSESNYLQLINSLIQSEDK